LVSRGRLNIATCLVTGSIETVMSVSVLMPPPCSSAPISRMLSRFLPSHGAIETAGTGVPIGVASGVAASLGGALVESAVSSGLPAGSDESGAADGSSDSQSSSVVSDTKMQSPVSSIASMS
jgi:hypothetical protein